MPPKRKRKIDPKKIESYYTFDLREKCDWSGELSYALGECTMLTTIQKDIISILNIKLTSILTKTNSKKINVGTDIEISIYIIDDDKRTEQAGLIENTKDKTSFSIWLPWKVASHLHMTLMSGRAKMLDITGTEPYKRIGSIHGMTISRDYEEYS